MDEAEFQQALNAPAPVTLVRGIKSQLRGFLIFLVLSVIAVCMIMTAKDTSSLLGGWLCLCLFGSFLVLSVLSIASPPSLIIDAQGFHLKRWHKDEGFLWKNISELVVSSMVKEDVGENIDKATNILSVAASAAAGGRMGVAGSANMTKIKMVFFNDSNPGKKAKMNVSISGYTNNIPAQVYGIEPEQLAQLMNRWREKAIANNR
jgi:hypothetical protein